MKKVIFTSYIILAVSLSTATHAATYGGGGGTSEDPYQIWTAEQMNTIGANPGDWYKHFKLMANINMSAYTGTQYNIIGNSTTEFTGTFDGNGHVISNLTYTTTATVDHVGLFGRTSNATIQNLGVKNLTISSGGYYVGGLVGYNIYSTITACYATGSVSGKWSVGGLAGINWESTVTSCYAICSVNGARDVGGLVGDNNGSLTACYAAGLVSGLRYAGGLTGYNYYYNLITTCVWDVQTSGQTGSAGGKGLTTEQMKTMSVYQNAGWANMGWMIKDGTDYPRLSWENTGGAAIPLAQAIPLVGSGTVNDPYLVSNAQEFALLSWYSGVLDKQIKLTADLNLSGVVLHSIGDLRPFAGMFDGNSHRLSNATINAIGSDSVGLFGYVGLEGQIKNLSIENVNITGRNYVGGLAGYNLGSITGCYSTGSVTGTAKHSGSVGGIEYSHSVGGLVGYNGSGGMVADCYSTSLMNGLSGVGGLTGANYGLLCGCYASGLVHCDYSAGGLVGENYFGSIIFSYATNAVIVKLGGDYGSCGGGLVGWNVYGILDTCYATGSVSKTGSGYGPIGGLVGEDSHGILNGCYATGLITGTNVAGGLIGYSDESVVTGCFWDKNASGQTTSAGGIGKTTTEMMTLTTYTSAGWDFTNNDGDQADWYMPGTDYPKLNEMSVSVPEMVGMTKEAALNEIRGAYLAAGIITEVSSDSVPAGCVISQSPVSGTLVGVGSEIDIIISLGVSVTVPDVIGLTQESAQTEIIAAGLTLGSITEILSEFVPAGCVISQLPAGGQTVLSGTSIDVVISLGMAYGGGDGTPENPYKIWTAEQMNTIGANPGDWYKHFKLMANINMSAYTGTQYNIIGNSTTEFTGTFDGNGHVISNLTYTTTATVDHVGLFGRTSNATIQNLDVENVSVSSGGSCVGGLVGTNNGGMLTTCCAAGLVSGSGSVGGLVGANNGGMLTTCCAAASVSGHFYIGGLAGSNNFGLLTSCYATGSVVGTDYYDYVGGLVGYNYGGTIISCYATGSVSGTGSVGGLMGYSVVEEEHWICDWICEPICDEYGCWDHCWENCYPIFIPIEAPWLVEYSFWDTNTSGCSISSGGTGKTTAEMQTLSTFASEDWDFSNTDGDPADWMMLREGEDYPRLAWQPIYTGDIAGLYGVDSVDLAFFIGKWLGVWYVRADIIDDSVVNIYDFNVLAASWMQTGCYPIPCTENGIAADITGDGIVDILDVTAFADLWLFMENPEAKKADIDHSGTVDLADLSILSDNWMRL